MTKYTNAKKFKRFAQIEHLGKQGVSINMNTGQVKDVVYDEGGICFGICCTWMKKMSRDKSFMFEGTDLSEADFLQTDMNKRFDTSKYDNALELLGLGTIKNKGAISTYNPKVIIEALDDYTKFDGANFALIVFGGVDAENKPWAHAVVAKLDQSVTGGLLNWSYPCAFFDPNIGQGMYSNHSDMASDIQTVIGSYYGVHWTLAYTIKCNSMN